nr:sulfatase-like hydrolase/transferase [uncultured Sphaerochaeta sp.]
MQGNQSKKPNILFILADDHGQWALGCYGNKEVKTPHLDELAENGIIYDNFYCTSPVCSPARASILTGTMPSWNGVHDWLRKGNADTSKYPNMKDHDHFKKKDHPINYLEGMKTYVSQLHEAGYSTALCGKWHLGASTYKRPEFDKWFTIFGGGLTSYYRPDFFEDGKFYDSHEYITSGIGSRAIDFIDEFAEEPEKPFYLGVHFTAPHTPWSRENHPERFWNLYEGSSFESAPRLPVHKDQVKTCMVGYPEERRRENINGYYAAISAMDEQIGAIIAKLKAEKLYDDTVIIFTSDNGMNLGQHGIWGKGNGTYPQNLYETSVKIPFIMRNPRFGIPGERRAEIASHYDVFSSMEDIAGLAISKQNLPGKSLFSRDEKDSIAVVFNEYGSVRMIREEKFKLIVNYDTQEETLFDLQDDPGEMHPLSNTNPIIAQLRLKMENWFAQYSRPEKDGRVRNVLGTGQEDLDLFNPEIAFYYEKEQRSTMY